MANSLRMAQVISDMAEFLSDFLPGSGNPSWEGHVSFKTIAEKVGVGEYWQPGTKHPMIVNLLSKTLTHQRGLFERLVLEIVNAGIVYRRKQGHPIRPEDIDTLNGYILAVGFKFPDLWDAEFIASLRVDGGQRARERTQQAIKEQEVAATERDDTTRELDELAQQFYALQREEDRHAAGFALEKVLNRLFALSGLSPREPFKLVGEQIDGSFELDHEIYLVEAKWEKGRLPESTLLVFRGKIDGKSPYTRGMVIAMNGVTEEAKIAIVKGKRPTFFIIDGYDLTMVLSGDTTLQAFLRQRQRILAEEGEVCVPYSDLWKGSRKR